MRRFRKCGFRPEETGDYSSWSFENIIMNNVNMTDSAVIIVRKRFNSKYMPSYKWEVLAYHPNDSVWYGEPWFSNSYLSESDAEQSAFRSKDSRESQGIDCKIYYDLKSANLRAGFMKESFRVGEVYNEGGDYTDFIITDFSLGLGNNYTDSHFISALRMEHPEMIDYLSWNIGSSDSVIFIFDGIGGRYEEEWAGADLIDFL